MLCAYKNALGRPNQGVHAYRLFGFAIVDVVMSVLGAIVIHAYTGYRLDGVLAAVFLSGIFLHWLFCVETKVSRLLKI